MLTKWRQRFTSLRTADVFPVVVSLPQKNFSPRVKLETKAEKNGCSGRLTAYTTFIFQIHRTLSVNFSLALQISLHKVFITHVVSSLKLSVVQQDSG